MGAVAWGMGRVAAAVAESTAGLGADSAAAGRLVAGSAADFVAAGKLPAGRWGPSSPEIVRSCFPATASSLVGRTLLGDSCAHRTEGDAEMRLADAGRPQQ